MLRHENSGDEAADSTARAAPAAAVKAPAHEASRLRIALALLVVYVVWGSTYLAIRVALAGFPPFLMGSIRFLLAGGVLLAFLLLRGARLPSARQWRNSGITGVLLLGGGNGLVCFAEQTVSSGLAAVAVASMPLFAAAFAGAFGHWPSRRDALGLAIGFVGVIALNIGGEMRASPIGALCLLGAPACWAFGSVWSRRQDLPDPWMNTAAQMLVGGVFSLVLALAIGERMHELPALKPALALGYLFVAGSLLGFSAYVYLLHHVRPALATSYAYVNPPIAVLFGVLLAGEHFSVLNAIAMAVILAGVAVILTAKR